MGDKRHRSGILGSATSHKPQVVSLYQEGGHDTQCLLRISVNCCAQPFKHMITFYSHPNSNMFLLQWRELRLREAK